MKKSNVDPFHFFEDPVSILHQFLSKVLTENDIVLDATCGNGHDTLFLRQQVGRNGIVKSIDIQDKAVNATLKLLSSNYSEDDYNNIEVIRESHDKLLELFPNLLFKAIVYNLGYLPKSDKTITTSSETTIKSVTQALSLLQSHGVVVICSYYGHDVGFQELSDLRKFTKGLAPNLFSVVELQICNRQNSPILFAIEKRTANLLNDKQENGLS